MLQKISEALSRLAPVWAGEGTRVENLERLSGGASMETWAFSVVGEGKQEEFVLRRRPVSVAEEDARSVTLAVEADLIRAAETAGAPVAQLVYVAKPEDDIGEAHVTRRVSGETLGRRIVSDPRFEAIRPTLARQCGEVLARIHTIPPSVAKLRTSDAAGELARYEEIYRSYGAKRPILELAFQHLKARIPDPMPHKVLHGDFRTGNLMIHPEAGVAAVLDWELPHLGDPAEDLGWLCVNSWRFGRSDKPVGGFGDYQDLLDGYRAAGGVEIPLERVLFWQALGSLKWGVMCLLMYGSYASGAESSVERPMIGRRVSETEVDLVNLLENGL